MGTASVVGPARICALQLLDAVHNLNVVGQLNHFDDNLFIVAPQFIGFDDGFQIPVGPIQVVVEDSHGKYVWHVSGA